MKLKRLAAIIGLGLMGAAATAQATPVWRFQDDSIDFILRTNTSGGYDLVESGNVLQGDIFIGVFEMPSAVAIPGGSLIPDGKELTGVSAVQLVGTETGGAPSNPASGTWIFAPVAGGLNSILALAGHTGVVGGNAGGGAVAAMWLNNSPAGLAGKAPSVTDRNLVFNAADADYPNTNCTSLVDCLKEASLGDLFQVDGFWGVNTSERNDPDNYWLSDPSDLFGSGPITYDAVKQGAETDRYGTFLAGLSNLWNKVEPVGFEKIVGTTECVGATYAADGCVQVKITGDILGGDGLENGAVARDDIDARKRVPEPATLGLLGLGMLGLGLMRRRMG